MDWEKWHHLMHDCEFLPWFIQVLSEKQLVPGSRDLMQVQIGEDI